MEKIRILHTNDLHSHFEKFPKIKRYLQKAQADNSVDQVLTFDAGDFMDRSHPLTDATDGQANIQLMNDFHYDAITIGNNEGISNPHWVLERLFDHANFPVVLANLREEDESQPHWATSYRILTSKKGTRIALIGLTAAYPMTYGPNHWHVKMLSTVMPGLLKKLEDRYDVLIMLTHIGLPMDIWLAKHYPQIDLIVGGHTHTLLEKGRRIGHTWITQTGKWGRYIGDIQLQLNEQHQVISIQPQTVATADLLAEDGDQETIQGYLERGKKILSQQKIAKLPEKFADDKEAAISVSLDAIADFAHTSLAMLSSGLFLQPFKKGINTRFDLQQALPHPMHVVRSTLLGCDLWRLVMEVEKNRHYLSKFHMVGMGFRGKIFGQIYYKGIKVDLAHRLVYVNGQEIDPLRHYQIAVLDHYVLVPFFPTLSIMGENEFLFPDFLSTVVGNYLAKIYPLKEKGEQLD